jgi:WD40 repeat protein
VFGVVAQGIDFVPHWEGVVNEYVTAIDWSSDGQTIAIGDASGAIHLLSWPKLELVGLQPSQGQSIDCLAFAADGQLLAAAGQDGCVRVWQMLPQPTLLTTLEHGNAWIDRMTWHPTQPLLAFQFGMYVQVWDAEAANVVETLSLEATAQDLQWQPQGEFLAVAAKNQVRVWETTNWEEQAPLDMASPAVAIAWSPDGRYLATGQLDRTLLVWEWGNPAPWQMRGFPGKVQQLAWSPCPTQSGAPLLAVTSVEGIVTWELVTWAQGRDGEGWDNQVLELHEAKVTAIAFQPQSLLLASAAQDGAVALWAEARAIGAILEGAVDGFSRLAWHPQGQFLLAGGVAGEVMIWRQSQRGKGFGR